MPKKIPRFKVIHCRVKGCGATKRFDRYLYPHKHVPASEILAWIRQHYKRRHTSKFKAFLKKALRTKRKKGIIDKRK